MDFIKKGIAESFKKNNLICICLNRINWESRIIGYVKNISASGTFEFEIIDEFGQKKGTKTFLFGSVKSLEIGGIYNNNLEKLDKKGFIKNQSIPKYLSPEKQHFHEKLHGLKEAKTLCTFFFGTEFSTGIIKEITKEELSIANIAQGGTDDGISVFDITLLTKVRSGSNIENRISFLSNLRQK